MCVIAHCYRGARCARHDAVRRGVPSITVDFGWDTILRAAPRERASFRPYLAVDCPPAESVCASMALLEHEGRPAPPRRRCAPHVLCAGAGLRCGAHRAPWARPLRACRWRACSRLLSLPHRQGEATMALASAGHGAACLCADLRLHPVFERFEHAIVRIGPLQQDAERAAAGAQHRHGSVTVRQRLTSLHTSKVWVVGSIRDPAHTRRPAWHTARPARHTTRHTARPENDKRGGTKRC